MPRKKKIVIDCLSPSSMQQGVMSLRDYRQFVQDRCLAFVLELANRGIFVARHIPTGGFDKYIYFGIESRRMRNAGAEAIIYAQQTGLIRSEWLVASASAVKVADVSPLLMAEFGAGINHDKNPVAHRHQMGAGTFPDQTHAFDAAGWWYQDTSGEWHHSDGIEPSMPMYRTALYLQRTVVVVARQMFK